MIKRSILAGMMAVNLLVASGVHAADMSFVFQRPLTLKGETSDSFLVGGGYGQRINQDWSLNADLSWLQVQSSASLSGALGYQILGGYRFDLGYPISFDGLAGVAGNGHSGIGIALGARAVYPFGESSSFGVELLYNTNRDFSVGARFSKWVSIPDIVPNFLGGKPAQLKQTATPPVVTTVAASKPAKAESEKIAEKEVKNANDTASTES
ncbi:hypothetical protein EBR96_06695, partial [bacterium]|nr:hypothetical protein [bacterium]